MLSSLVPLAVRRGRLTNSHASSPRREEPVVLTKCLFIRDPDPSTEMTKSLKWISRRRAGEHVRRTVVEADSQNVAGQDHKRHCEAKGRNFNTQYYVEMVGAQSGAAQCATRVLKRSLSARQALRLERLPVLCRRMHPRTAIDKQENP